MSESEHHSDADGTDRRESAGRSETETGTGAAEWLTASALRIALAALGFVLLLFALGQAVGVDLIGMFADALATQLGRWLAVALFALLLILIAARGFGTSQST